MAGHDWNDKQLKQRWQDYNPAYTHLWPSNATLKPTFTFQYLKMNKGDFKGEKETFLCIIKTILKINLLSIVVFRGCKMYFLQDVK